MTIAQLAAQTLELAERLEGLSERHPEWTAKRNDLRNISLLSPAGEYEGYVDFVTEGGSIELVFREGV